MTLGRIGMALTGLDITDMATELRERWFPGEVPQRITVDSHEVSPSVDWIERHLGRTGEGAEEGVDEGAVEGPDVVAAFFGDNSDRYLTVHANKMVRLSFDFEGEAAELVDALSDYPFEIASFQSRYREWQTKEKYWAPSFGGAHFPHGWACAFRGEGHRSLVSRRWLDTGPWHLLHGPNDTTLVQFHDLKLGAAEALAQAKPAHEHMGHSNEGGFLRTPYVYRKEIKGFYDASRRVLKVVVLGRTVPAVEMRDACAARRDNLLAPEQPVDNVAFVFLDPAEARAHLPRLWPYGLECWTVIDDVETRLDTEERPEGAGDRA
ncbi:hypothetical protein [Streptomyces sp. 8ZJF_21]|nr:hypothetical protein [Streptomyces sp. 8ZJF_21]MCD9588809.1 hypothetical protein [Streptomyces sp. 8ZJF_21]